MSIQIPIRRSMRNEAIRATQRINEYIMSDLANSDSDESTTQTDNILFHPDDKDYACTINIIHYLINECNSAEFEDQRTDIAEKIFTRLINDPSILIYEPKFRKVVINKMKELEIHLNTRINSYKYANYGKLFNEMKLSMRINVRNSVMRNEIYKHINDINDILTEYEAWSQGTSLTNQIQTLYVTLETIKKYPFYVPDRDSN